MHWAVLLLQQVLNVCLPPPMAPIKVNQILEVGGRQEGTRRYSSLDKWAAQISSLHAVVQNKLVLNMA